METLEFAQGSPLLEGAFRMADEAHVSRRRPEHDTEIDHPVEVARLLDEEGFGEPVVAAALLHDVVEDTDASREEIEQRFGPEVAELVAEMTEDERIQPYGERKAEHRERVSHDRRAAAIYAADKVSSTRALSDPEDASEEKLDHYRRTFEMLCEGHPDLPFLPELRDELERLASARGD